MSRLSELHIDIETMFDQFDGGVPTSAAEASLMHFNYLHGSRVQQLKGDTRYLTVLTLDRNKQASRRGAVSVPVDARGWDEQIEGLYLRLSEERADEHWYLALGLQTERAAKGKSAQQAHSEMPQVLFLDIDIAGFGHAQKKLPLPTAEEALKYLQRCEDALGAPFTTVSWTGGGIHATARVPDLTPNAAEDWRRLRSALAAEAGIHIDSLTNTGQQLMRLVGSRNLTAFEQEVRWLRFQPEMARLRSVDVQRAWSMWVEEHPKPVLASPRPNSHAPARKAAPTKGGRVGDKFNAQVSSTELLTRFWQVAFKGARGVFPDANGRYSTTDTHVQVLDGERVCVFGERLAEDSGLHLAKKYDPFGIVADAFCGGSTSLAARALGYLAELHGTQFAQPALRWFASRQTSQAVENALPRRGGTRPVRR